MTNGEYIIFEYRHGANEVISSTFVSRSRLRRSMALQQLPFLQGNEHGASGRPSRIDCGIRQKIFGTSVRWEIGRVPEDDSMILMNLARPDVVVAPV